MWRVGLASTLPARIGRLLVVRYFRAVVFVLLLVGSVYPPVGGVPLAGAAAAGAVMLAGWEVQRRLPAVHPAVVLVVPLFVMFGVAGWLRPPVDTYGRDELVGLVTATALSALAAALVRDRAHLAAYAQVWTGSGLVLAAGAITGAAVAGRAVGFGDTNPIWLGRAIGSALVALVWFAATRRLRWWLAAPAGMLLAAGLAATGSRGPMLATAVGAGAVVAAVVRPGLRLLSAALVGTVALVVTVLPQLSSDSRMAGLADPVEGMRDSGRTGLLEATWPVLAEHPWGVGWGGWSTQTGIWWVRYPHNLWLEVAVEAGWLAGAVVVAVTVWVLARLWRAAPGDPAARLLLGLLASEVVAVSASGNINARTFWAMLTLGWLVTAWPTHNKEADGHPPRRVLDRRFRDADAPNCADAFASRPPLRSPA